MDPKRLVQRGKPDVVWLNLDTQARRMGWLQHHASVLLGSSLYLWELSFHICKMGMFCVPCEIMVYNFFLNSLSECQPDAYSMSATAWGLHLEARDEHDRSDPGSCKVMTERWREIHWHIQHKNHTSSKYLLRIYNERGTIRQWIYVSCCCCFKTDQLFFFLFWILALRKVKGKSN